MKNQYLEFKGKIRSAVETSLSEHFQSFPDSQVSQAARYVVLGGGHRWRALAAVSAGQIFHAEAYEITMPFACGVEMAHAASLVLDDLPSMDDATMRRGKPCVHLKFPTWAVDMVPVFLITTAYQISLNNPRASHRRRVASALALGAAGVSMIYGQEQDVTQPTADDHSDEVVERYRWKSGELYGAATRAGGILCGASDEEAKSLEDCGVSLGLSYQFLDDVADAVGRVDETGKDGNKDVDKLTAVSLYGVEGAKAKASEFVDRAMACLEPFGSSADALRRLVAEASWASS